MKREKSQHLCLAVGCCNPTKQLTATKWRSYCSRECMRVSQGQKVWADMPAPKCLMCDNIVKTRTKGAWVKCCSQACATAYDSEQLLHSTLTTADVLAMIDQLPSDYDWRRFVGEYKLQYNLIKQWTINCPISWQVKKRIAWLRGETQSRAETISKDIAAIDHTGSAKSVHEARALTRGNKACSVCGGKRKYDRVAKKYPKFCSSQCSISNQRAVLIRRLIKVLKERVPKTAHNRRTDIDNAELLAKLHHVDKLTKTEIANVFGVDRETITSRLAQHDIKLHKYARSSLPQREIVSHIAQHYECVTDATKIIPSGELDVYIPTLKVAIEYCGLYWHSVKHARIDRQYHARKYKECAERGIRLLTIFEDEWLINKQRVLSKIDNIIGIDNARKVHARKCVVKVISTSEKTAFLDKHHIQGNGPSSINYGLFYDNEMVACLGMISKSNNSFVLNRYATSASIRGGFTELPLV